MTHAETDVPQPVEPLRLSHVVAIIDALRQSMRSLDSFSNDGSDEYRRALALQTQLCAELLPRRGAQSHQGELTVDQLPLVANEWLTCLYALHATHASTEWLKTIGGSSPNTLAPLAQALQTREPQADAVIRTTA